MVYPHAKKTDANAIPIIDISALCDNSQPKEIAYALHAASKDLGFIYIKGHGIADETINAARASAYAFFRSSISDKKSVSISEQHRGWLGQGGASMHEDVNADLKESFIWGLQSGTENKPHALRGKNHWPEFLPSLQQHAMRYFKEAHTVAHHLMRGFAIGLDLEEDFFLRTCEQPLSRASFVYYPTQDAQMGDKQFGVGPHTDFGVLTVLCQDKVGGLQVQNINGDWIEAPPVPGTLVINVGDLLARWTDGAYKSTPHRVVNSSGRERLSLVLAFDPEPDTNIDAREVFGGSYQAKEPPITCGDYLIWRFNKAFSYRTR